MKKEFVPYEIALELKELGFDEPCFAKYTIIPEDEIDWFTITEQGITDKKSFGSNKNYNSKSFEEEGTISSPTISHVFRWFREKYNLHHSISILQRSCRYHFKIRTIECESDLKPFGDNKIIFEDGPRKKYEDIELDCLKKLIEIVKDGKYEERK